jgi:opacity protein-like surface antigen
MKLMLLVMLMLLYLMPLAQAAEYSPAVTEILQKAEAECQGFEGGQFHMEDTAVSGYDFTGDGKPEEVVDASQFACSTSASMWGGTGGTMLWVVVDGKPYEFLAHRWKVVDMDGQNVLLLAVHSSQCGDTIGPCYRAMVWSDGEFRTTR